MAQIQIYGTLSQSDPKQDEYIANAYDACEEKGATIPSEKNLANLADCIETIQGGTVVPPEAGNLVNLVVGTLPKTSYIEGEPLDLSTAVILGNYSNGGQYDVTGNCTFIANNPVLFYDTKITVSLDDKTLDIPITVAGKPVEAPASTIVLYHLDGNFKDEVSGETSSDTFTPAIGKFNGAAKGYGTTPNLSQVPSITNAEFLSGKYTIECWAKNVMNDTYREPPELLVSNDRIFDTASIRSNGLRPYRRNTATIIYTPTDYDETKWHHFAITIDNGTYVTYLDGKANVTGTINSYFAIQKFVLCSSRWTYDEILICNEVKYAADFEPPHAPYYLANQGGE